MSLEKKLQGHIVDYEDGEEVKVACEKKCKCKNDKTISKIGTKQRCLCEVCRKLEP